jgi:hypothetical protein
VARGHLAAAAVGGQTPRRDHQCWKSLGLFDPPSPPLSVLLMSLMMMLLLLTTVIMWWRLALRRDPPLRPVLQPSGPPAYRLLLDRA